MERLAPIWEARRRELENRPGRKRAPGAGRKPTPFWVQLFATMTMWRQGLTVRAAGELFGVHERTIRRWRDAVEDLLVAHGFQPPGVDEPIRTVEDLAAYVEANDIERVAVDRPRPDGPSPVTTRPRRRHGRARPRPTSSKHR